MLTGDSYIEHEISSLGEFHQKPGKFPYQMLVSQGMVREETLNNCHQLMLTILN